MLARNCGIHTHISSLLNELRPGGKTNQFVRFVPKSGLPNWHKLWTNSGLNKEGPILHVSFRLKNRSLACNLFLICIFWFQFYFSKLAFLDLKCRFFETSSLFFITDEFPFNKHVALTRLKTLNLKYKSKHTRQFVSHFPLHLLFEDFFWTLCQVWFCIWLYKTG